MEPIKKIQKRKNLFSFNSEVSPNEQENISSRFCIKLNHQDNDRTENRKFSFKNYYFILRMIIFYKPFSFSTSFLLSYIQ